ncbi:DUF2007 domain-containing protein [bacterium]|nr:DUF2007 domain-containing protein [bacterium]
MRDGLVAVATYLNELDAAVARNRLDSLGVAAVVQADNCGGMRPHLDLIRGVKLLVHTDDREKALEILADLEADDSSPPWLCPACGEEVEGNFSACWNCGQERP